MKAALIIVELKFNRKKEHQTQFYGFAYLGEQLLTLVNAFVNVVPSWAKPSMFGLRITLFP